MKKVFLALAVITMAFTQSCEGPEGPQGQVGQTGYSAESDVYEITNVNFLAPDFAILFTFGHEILPSDHVLVYRLSSQFNGQDVWQLIPNYYYKQDGSGTLDFGYNYDFTTTDVNIFLEGEALGTVSDPYRLGQIFRIVIVPGQFANRIDANNFNQVTAALKLTEADFKKSRRN